MVENIASEGRYYCRYTGLLSLYMIKNFDIGYLYACYFLMNELFSLMAVDLVGCDQPIRASRFAT